MQKNNIEKRIEEFSLKNKTKKLIKEQIKLYESSKSRFVNTYKIGDTVVLSKQSLIHGSRCNFKELKTISKTGIISSEFLTSIPRRKKKPYVVEFWSIQKTIKLSDWLQKYAGVTIDFYDLKGNLYKSVLSTFDDIKNNILKENNFRTYIIHQNMEQRFVPSEIKSNANVAFIVSNDFDNKLFENDIFNEKLDRGIVKDLLPNWYYNKYLKNRTFDYSEPGREKGLLFGVPANLIEGILVSRKIEQDKKTVKKIKELFPKTYICNIDGIIIM